MAKGRLRAVLGLVVMVSFGWAQRPIASIQTAEGLKIVVLEGEDGVNIIEKKTAVTPVVDVRDRNDLPVAGAVVTFLVLDLDGGGKSAAFATGSRMTVATNAGGRAAASDLRLIGNGTFRIQVQASYQGQVATTTVHQTNFATVADAAKLGKSPGGGTSAGAAGAATGGVAAGTAGGAAAAGSGLSGAAIGGIAAGAVGAGIGTAVVVKHLTSSSSSNPPDCTSLSSQVQSDASSEAQICSGVTTSLSQCQNALQRVLNDLGQYCTCVGTANLNSTPQAQSLIAELKPTIQQLGVTLPASCGF